MKLNIGKDLYLKGRIGWRGLSKNEYLEKSNYKIINATALMDKYINWNNCGYISKERYEESEEIMLKEKDILISKDGTLGKIGYVKDIQLPCTVASGIFVLRNTIPEKLNFDYLYHLLKSNVFKDFINRNKATGSTISHLYQRDLENFEINLPEYNIQCKIASILNSLDNKIELNNKINNELEAMAKSIYDYWFLQFEFPNEEGKPYKSSGGKMVWNEELKREIPEGWETKRLSDIEPNIITGKTPLTKNENYYNGNIPFITISDVRKNMFIVNTEQTLSEEGAKTQEKKYIPEDALCVTCIASPGLVAFSTKLSQTNQQINSIIFEKNYNKLYLYYYLKNYFKYTTGAKTGNTFANMNKEDFSRILVLYPKTKLLTLFQDKTLSLIKLIKKNTIENQELTALRDFLLPLLMNGQVGFKEDKAEAEG